MYNGTLYNYIYVDCRWIGRKMDRQIVLRTLEEYAPDELNQWGNMPHSEYIPDEIKKKDYVSAPD